MAASHFSPNETTLDGPGQVGILYPEHRHAVISARCPLGGDRDVALVQTTWASALPHTVRTIPSVPGSAEGKGSDGGVQRLEDRRDA
ncbi:hypothetical protein CCMA1212_002108 [Trichoderma ghanense]|uniref:Uncharacterized protein n=1 Tax=Trichoderma ghanense TaxID=65468 RepID=A0ABY2HFR6_9HYPO